MEIEDGRQALQKLVDAGLYRLPWICSGTRSIQNLAPDCFHFYCRQDNPKIRAVLAACDLAHIHLAKGVVLDYHPHKDLSIGFTSDIDFAGVALFVAQNGLQVDTCALEGQIARLQELVDVCRGKVAQNA